MEATKKIVCAATKSQDIEVEENNKKYIQGIALVLLTLNFMFVSFVLALDNTILGSHLPVSNRW